MPQLKGLAFDSTGTLFGYDFSSDQLVSIDPNTAVYTVLGSSGFVLDGPGNQLFDTGSDLIVVMDQFGQGVLGSLDRITGTGTTLFNNDDLLGKQILGFARPSGFGTLGNDTSVYLSDSISLYTLDVATGAVMKGQNIQFSSCDCVPEPTSFVLFGATIVFPFLRPFLRKKRRKVLSRLPSLNSLSGLSASAHKRFQRFFMSPHSKKQHTRRVVLESLEPRLLMTGAFYCDSTKIRCPCCEVGGSTKPDPATGFATTYGQSMGDFSLAPSAVQEANYSSNTTIASNGMYGNGRLTETTPTLVLVGTSDSGMQHIQLPWSGTDIRNFRQTAIGGNVFQSDTGGTDQITREGNVLVYRNLSGETIRFRDFSSNNTMLRGQFLNREDAYGNRLQVTSNLANGAIATLTGYQANSATPSELWQYTYIGIGLPNAGKLLSVQLRRNDSTLLRSTLYTYYNKNDTNGNLGDLKLITVRDGSANVIDNQYFRYYKSGQADFGFGFNSGLKYSFDFESFRRLAANTPNIDLATDVQIAPYAREYFQYDSSRRIVRHDLQGEGCTVCTGGIGTTTFVYETRPAVPGDYNRWAFKVTQTLPDGNQRIIYENYRRQIMLDVNRVLVDPANPSNVGKMWGTYTRYDPSSGKPIWSATPSALELPASLSTIEQYPDLMHDVAGNLQYVRDATGVIYVTAYYTNTTATENTPGGIRYYASQQSLRRGEFGSDILQSSTQYFARSVGGLTTSYIASETQYPNEDLSNPLTTSYQYTFFAGSTAIQSQTTNKPIVVSAQNGSNTIDSTTTVFDQAGRAIWTKDQDGFLTFRAYDPESGAVVREIVDVDTTKTADFSALPAGWVTPSGGGLHLKTTHTVDRLERTIEMVDPNGNVTYTRYDDVAHSQRVYQGWNALTNRPTGPTQAYRDDIGGSYTETLTMSAAPAITAGKPTGTESVSNVESLSRTYLNAAGQVIYRDDYFNLDGLTFSNAPNLGTEGVHFYRTRYQYNHQGLLERELAPNGTINWRIYDGQRRLVSTWIGTNDTTANGLKWSPTNNTGSSNMVQVSAYEYDGNAVGNGNLTKTTALVGVGTDRVNQFAYDFRDRQVASKSGVETIESESTNRPVMYQVCDNMGRVTSNSQYDGDGVSIQTDANNDGTPDSPDAARRRRLSNTFYDNQSRIFRSDEILVDQSTGAAGSIKLQNDTWYDKRGNTIQMAIANGPATQMRTDGAGRQSASYVLGNIPSGSWSAAGSLSTAIVLSQQESIYDANGNVIQTIGRERFHDADPTATGALGTASSGIRARVSTSTSYFDAADRVMASVNLGTNGGVTYTRPATPPAATDAALVGLYEYDTAGRLANSTDPRGIVNRVLYDALGRQVTEIQNFTGGLPGSGTDVTSRFTYSSPNQLRTIVAVQAGGSVQTTEYVYQSRTATGSAINSNDLLTETRYPDPATGLPSVNEGTVSTVNALGDSITFSDQNGTVHGYAYDAVGRRTADAVTVLGSGVDGAVRRIETGYDSAGLLFRTTSLDASSGGTVVNELQRRYNGFGQLIQEYQDHFGPVNPSLTPKVTYSYSEASGGNHSRFTTIVYPNGRTMQYEYDPGIDTAISRLSRLIGDADGGGLTSYEEYDYLGESKLIERGRPESGIKLTMVSQTGSVGDTGDQYKGLDRFGRVVDQRWIEGSGGSATDIDRQNYQFDRNSNRTSRINQLDAAFSETYAFDGVDRLVDYARGGGGTGPQAQQWNLDALGNWTTITSDGTPESRTHNAQNELTAVEATSLSYDANGNMTQDEAGRQLQYNAWNRLVRVSLSGDQVAAYQYDGFQHRIVTTVGNGPSAIARDLFYSASWQLLEQRIRTGSSQGSVAEEQFVWSVAYIDGLILRDRDADLNNATGVGGLEERVYALQDALWNTTALVDVNGNVLNRFAYTPYGVVETLNPNWTPTSSPTIPWAVLFRGYIADEGTGLHHARARQYSHTLGRFMSRDPYKLLDYGVTSWDGYQDGYNRYHAYMVPNATDPTGLCSKQFVETRGTLDFNGPCPRAKLTRWYNWPANFWEHLHKMNDILYAGSIDICGPKCAEEPGCKSFPFQPPTASTFQPTRESSGVESLTPMDNGKCRVGYKIFYKCNCYCDCISVPAGSDDVVV